MSGKSEPAKIVAIVLLALMLLSIVFVIRERNIDAMVKKSQNREILREKTANSTLMRVLRYRLDKRKGLIRANDSLSTTELANVDKTTEGVRKTRSTKGLDVTGLIEAKKKIGLMLDSEKSTSCDERLNYLVQRVIDVSVSVTVDLTEKMDITDDDVTQIFNDVYDMAQDQMEDRIWDSAPECHHLVTKTDPNCDFCKSIFG